MGMRRVLVFLLFFFGVAESEAYKVLIPEVYKAQSLKGKTRIEIETSTGKVNFLNQGKKENWPILDREFRLPDQIIFFESLQRIVFLGGLGSPGLSLGFLGVVDYKGKILREHNAKEKVPNLSSLVNSKRRFTNFPWIKRVKKEDKLLRIKIVGGKEIVYDVASLDWK